MFQNIVRFACSWLSQSIGSRDLDPNFFLVESHENEILDRIWPMRQLWNGATNATPRDEESLEQKFGSEPADWYPSGWERGGGAMKAQQFCLSDP
jgi:hypothetical protein